MATARASSEAIADLKQRLADRNWRLCNLYWITDRDGNKVRFQPNWAQQRLMDEWHYRNIILKSRQIGFCLEPGMRVLTADLRWVPIGDLQPGQRLVAVDEQPLKPGKGATRHMRTAEVEGTLRVFRDAYRVAFDDGRHVICTSQHPWLSRPALSPTNIKWRRLGDIGKGRLKVGCQVRWVARPWAESTFEDGWFGGLMDGEGSLAVRNGQPVNACVTQRRGPVFDRAEAYLRERGYTYRIEADDSERPGKFGKVPVPKLCVGRMDELFRLIGQTKPARFIGKAFWEDRWLPGRRNGDVGWATITDIEHLPDQEMVDLQTSTGTYIAEGFVSHNTTFIQLLFLDLVLFNSNMRCGTIAQDRDTAKAIFQDKVKQPYDWLPDALKAQRPTIRDSANELALGNNSAIRVGTSLRGGTLQYLHVSEFGKTCAKFPDKAREIVTGALNTVKPGQFVFIESTAEGQDGHFFRFTEKARAQQRMAAPLSVIDYKFHFYGWWEDPSCWIDPAGVVIDEEAEKHFERLEREHGIALNEGQKAWWTVTKEAQQDDMDREYPAHPDEAFAAAVDGSYYGKLVAKAEKEGRVGDFPAVPGFPVQTFHDIGVSLTDYHSIWFAQFLPGEIRHLHFYQNSGEGMPFYADYIAEQYQKNGWVRGDEGYDWFPHDGRVKEWGTGKTRLEQAKEKGLRPRIPAPMFRADGINAVRAILPISTFDAKGCSEGIKVLKNYKRKWNDKTGAWMSEPLHNEASHGADSERTLAMAHREVHPAVVDPEKARRDEMVKAQQQRVKDRQKGKRRAA